MKPVLLLGVLLALLAACEDKNKNKTCGPFDGFGCTEEQCDDPLGNCRGELYECQDGEWVFNGYCDRLPPEEDAGPDARPDAGMDGSVPDAGRDAGPDGETDGSVPDAGTGADATIL